MSGYIIGAMFMALGAVMIFGAATKAKDDTDPPDGRSGLKPMIDSATGCHYLVTAFGGMSQSMKVLEFIHAELDAKRPFPTNAKIAAHMGWKNQHSSLDALNRLAIAGHIQLKDRIPSGRGWKWIYEVAA